MAVSGSGTPVAGSTEVIMGDLEEQDAVNAEGSSRMLKLL